VIILDTDVLSALMLVSPDETVIQWLDRQAPLNVFTTTITLFEIRMGFSLLPDGARRLRLETAFARFVDDILDRRILMFDGAAAERAGALAAERKLRGFNIGLGDTLIAGIALAHGATIASGNLKDFRDVGAQVIDPWHANQ
jgi:predicted nucleic acid-binding protein